MKKLSLCLAFCLILTMIPIGAMLVFAEGTTNDTETATSTPWVYNDVAKPSLTEALAVAAQANPQPQEVTVYLTADLDTTVEVDLSNYTFSLTIEGKNLGTSEDTPVYPTITVAATTAITVSKGTVTLKNINAVSNGTSTTATLVLGDKADVTLENVNLTNSTGSAISAAEGAEATLRLEDNASISAPQRNGIELYNSTSTVLTLYMYGGSITAKTYGISGNNGTVTAYIYGGTVTSSGAGVVTGKTDDHITVYGGTFKNTTAANQVIHSNIPSTLLGGTYKGAATLNGDNSLVQYPDGKTELTLQPVMQTGASIRTNADSWGIRFQSTLPTAWLNYLNDKGATVTYGTLVCPTDLLGEADFTMENENVLVNIPANKGISTDGANTVLSAALVNLKEGNENRAFAARAYISITVNGQTHTVYSDFNEEDHVRSMVQVAQKALADVKDASDADNGYTTEVTAWMDANGNQQTGTAYTCYSEEQWKAIWSYVDPTVYGSAN